MGEEDVKVGNDNEMAMVSSLWRFPQGVGKISVHIPVRKASVADDAGRTPSIGSSWWYFSSSLDGDSSGPIKVCDVERDCGRANRIVGKAESCMWQHRILLVGILLILLSVPCLCLVNG